MRGLWCCRLYVQHLLQPCPSEITAAHAKAMEGMKYKVGYEYKYKYEYKCAFVLVLNRHTITVRSFMEISSTILYSVILVSQT